MIINRRFIVASAISLIFGLSPTEVRSPSSCGLSSGIAPRELFEDINGHNIPLSNEFDVLPIQQSDSSMPKEDVMRMLNTRILDLEYTNLVLELLRQNNPEFGDLIQEFEGCSIRVVDVISESWAGVKTHFLRVFLWNSEEDKYYELAGIDLEIPAYYFSKDGERIVGIQNDSTVRLLQYLSTKMFEDGFNNPEIFLSNIGDYQPLPQSLTEEDFESSQGNFDSKYLYNEFMVRMLVIASLDYSRLSSDYLKEFYSANIERFSFRFKINPGQGINYNSGYYTFYLIFKGLDGNEYLVTTYNYFGGTPEDQPDGFIKAFMEIFPPTGREI